MDPINIGTASQSMGLHGNIRRVRVRHGIPYQREAIFLVKSTPDTTFDISILIPGILAAVVVVSVRVNLQFQSSTPHSESWAVCRRVPTAFSPSNDALGMHSTLTHKFTAQEDPGAFLSTKRVVSWHYSTKLCRNSRVQAVTPIVQPASSYRKKKHHVQSLGARSQA